MIYMYIDFIVKNLMEPVIRSIISVFPGRAIEGRIHIEVCSSLDSLYLLLLFVKWVCLFIYIYCKDTARCTEIHRAPVFVS